MEKQLDVAKITKLNSWNDIKQFIKNNKVEQIQSELEMFNNKIQLGKKGTLENPKTRKARNSKENTEKELVEQATTSKNAYEIVPESDKSLKIKEAKKTGQKRDKEIKEEQKMKKKQKKSTRVWSIVKWNEQRRKNVTTEKFKTEIKESTKVKEMKMEKDDKTIERKQQSSVEEEEEVKKRKRKTGGSSDIARELSTEPVEIKKKRRENGFAKKEQVDSLKQHDKHMCLNSRVANKIRRNDESNSEKVIPANAVNCKEAKISRKKIEKRNTDDNQKDSKKNLTKAQLLPVNIQQDETGEYKEEKTDRVERSVSKRSKKENNMNDRLMATKNYQLDQPNVGQENKTINNNVKENASGSKVEESNHKMVTDGKNNINTENGVISVPDEKVKFKNDYKINIQSTDKYVDKLTFDELKEDPELPRKLKNLTASITEQDETKDETKHDNIKDVLKEQKRKLPRIMDSEKEEEKKKIEKFEKKIMKSVRKLSKKFVETAVEMGILEHDEESSLSSSCSDSKSEDSYSSSSGSSMSCSCSECCESDENSEFTSCSCSDCQFSPGSDSSTGTSDSESSSSESSNPDDFKLVKKYIRKN